MSSDHENQWLTWCPYSAFISRMCLHPATGGCCIPAATCIRVTLTTRVTARRITVWAQNIFLSAESLRTKWKPRTRGVLISDNTNEGDRSASFVDWARGRLAQGIDWKRRHRYINRRVRHINNRCNQLSSLVHSRSDSTRMRLYFELRALNARFGQIKLCDIPPSGTLYRSLSFKCSLMWRTLRNR